MNFLTIRARPTGLMMGLAVGISLFLTATSAQATPANGDRTPGILRRSTNAPVPPAMAPTAADLLPTTPTPGTSISRPADLTDPLFNSREPRADWFLVVKYGGARLGLSSQMPGFDGALSDERIEELVEHLKQLVDTSRFPPGELNFLRPILTTKAFPEDEALLITRFESGTPPAADNLLSTLYYARRFGARYQGEVKLNHFAEDGGSAEVEELELGFKWAFHDNLERQALYTLGLEFAFPIEDSEASEAAIPYLSFARGLSDAVTLQGQLKAVLPFDDVDLGRARLSAIVHWMPSMWPRSVSPALEVAITEPFIRRPLHRDRPWFLSSTWVCPRAVMWRSLPVWRYP